MSNVCARRLMAGTVNPDTSPRARAVYRSWMLALRAPSAWLASQTIHCAAAVVASSVEKAAVQARSRMAVDRKAASSSMTRTSPSRCAAARIVVSRSAVEVATWGIGRGSPRWSLRRPWYGALATSGRAIPQIVGFTTIRKTIATSRMPSIMPPRWMRLTRAMSSGGGPLAPGGGGVDVISITRSTSLRCTKNE